ncbi:MAG: hypothetical protein K6A23_05035, partial [Butyrivibrio sp.]|nr:hypothetical protein [Butyrivibrio sp.]
IIINRGVNKMIEKYLYSIPKSKKIFYGILIFMTFFSLLSYRVHSGLFSWIADTVTDNITDEIFTAINQSLADALSNAIDWFFKTALDPFGPNMDFFTNHTKFGTISLKTFLDNFSVFTGMFLCTLIFGFSMCVYFFSGKFSDSRDTPISLFGRYILAIAICYKNKLIYKTVMAIVDDFYTSLTDLENTMTKDKAGILGIVSGSESAGFQLFGEAIAMAVFPGVMLVILIIQLILIWKLLKGFIKLYAEMISRYIVTMVLLIMFAAFGGTIVSNNTVQIFKSYLRTLFCSFIVMIFNITWFKGCFCAVLGTTEGFTLIQYVFLLEILAFGLKFDGMLRSMGLGVATGGSRIASAIGGSGRNLANSLRNANDARKAGGNLLKAGGLATGNKAMFDAGDKLSAGIGDLLSGKKGGDPANMAAEYGKMANGKKIDDNLVTPEQARDIINNALKNPGNQDAINAVNGLSDNMIKKGTQALLADSGIKVNDASLYQFRGADGKYHSGIKVNGERVQGTGKNKTSHGVNGVICSSGAFNSSQDLGNGMGLNCANSLKNGESCFINEAADLAGQKAADALKTAQDNGVNFGDKGYIQKAGKDDNGLETFKCFDSNGNQVGTISGDEFIAASNINGNEKSTADHNATAGSDDEAPFGTGKGYEGTSSGTDDGSPVGEGGDSYGNSSSYDGPDGDGSPLGEGGDSYEDSSSYDGSDGDGSPLGEGGDSYGNDDDSHGNTDSGPYGSGTYADNIMNELNQGSDYDQISPFEPVEGNQGVYKATATYEDGSKVDIYATDKGIHPESHLNNSSESFMYVGQDSNGNKVKYDVNVGKKYRSSNQKDYGNKTGYSKMEEEKVSDESSQKYQNNKPKGKQNDKGRK